MFNTNDYTTGGGSKGKKEKGNDRVGSRELREDKFVKMSSLREKLQDVAEPDYGLYDSEIQVGWRMSSYGGIKSGSGMTARGKTVVTQPIAAVTNSIVVNKNDIREKLLEVVNSRSNAPFKVVAPTGCGKTSYFPFVLAEMTKGKILVVQPAELQARSAHNYVTGSLGRNAGYYTMKQLTLPEDKVIYCWSNDLMNGLLVNSQLLAGVGAIILDEAHDASAEYYVLRALLYVRGGGIKVLYTSATFEDSKSEFKRDGFRISKEETPFVDPETFAVSNNSKAPWSAAQIRDRVLVIAADELEVSKICNYYLENGVYADKLVIPPTQRDIDVITAKLKGWKGYNAVVVADSSVEYGVTLPIESVIDIGRKLSFEIKPSENLITLVKRRINEQESLQRAGRAGRLSNGTYTRFSGELTAYREIETCQKVHAYLWLKALDIKPLEAVFSKVASLVEPVTRLGARQLLSLKIHPFLARRYMDDEGYFYRNYASVLNEYSLHSSLLFNDQELFAEPSDGWYSYIYTCSRTSKKVELLLPLNPINSAYLNTMCYFSLTAGKYTGGIVSDPTDTIETEYIVPVPENAELTFTDSLVLNRPRYQRNPENESVVAIPEPSETVPSRLSIFRKRRSVRKSIGVVVAPMESVPMRNVSERLRRPLTERSELHSLKELPPGTYIMDVNKTEAHFGTLPADDQLKIESVLNAEMPLSGLYVDQRNYCFRLFLNHWNNLQAEYFRVRTLESTVDTEDLDCCCGLFRKQPKYLIEDERLKKKLKTAITLYSAFYSLGYRARIANISVSYGKTGD